MPNHATAISLLDAYRNGSHHPAVEVAKRHARAEECKELLAIRELDGSADDRAEALAGADRSLPMFGVPVVIKDNVAQAGKPNRAGRIELAGGPSDRDAAIVTRLVRAGAILLGRANMDELAYGVTGSNPHTGQVLNPRNATLHPGGSSAGSAAAVGAGIAPVAVGTDTAGSVRIPAALCGLVGIRPTHGLVPAEGVAPLCPSLDTAGAIATTVADAALLLSVLADRVELASAASRLELVRELRLAAIEGSFAVELDGTVKESWTQACEVLARLVKSSGTTTIGVLANGPRASGPIIGSEAAYAWQRELEAHPDWFGEEVAGHLNKGAAIKAVRYFRARDESAAVVRAIDEALSRYDVVVLPATATVATPADSPGAQLQFLALTVPFSLGGYPSISVPMGECDGRPVGLQIVGRRGEDATVIAVAAAFERVTA